MSLAIQSPSLCLRLDREDDSKWPQKNKDGRQELEIRMGSEHISFEVRIRPVPSPSQLNLLMDFDSDC
jgi:protein mago nashi